MEKNEHAIFLDIPTGRKNGRFHSAVLSTYAIDLLHFDHIILNTLHRKQIISVNVLADYGQMCKSMDFVSPAVMERTGKEYTISIVPSAGAFHPKINFFVGDDSALVLLGTGNLTVAGHGKNHEVFSGFMIDDTDEKHRPLIEECWRYLSRFTSQCSPFVYNRIKHEIPDNCKFLKEKFQFEPHHFCDVQDGLKAALLYNDDTSGILKQITELIPLGEVMKVTVISPFFDEGGDTLLSLASLCPNAKLDVLIQEGCSLPPCKMPKSPRISFYDFDKTARGQNHFSLYERQLHAKIFHFKTESMEYCLVGSANATAAGLGTIEKRGINEEFSVLYSSQNRHFLSELGLTARKKLDIDVRDIKRTASNKNNSSQMKICLLSAEYESGKVTISYSGKLSSDMLLVIDFGSSKLFETPQYGNDGFIVINVNLGKSISTCYVVNQAGDCISNKVFVNIIEQLEATNPSKTSRSVNRFISLIDNEGYNGMDVASILSDIMCDLINEQDEPINLNISPSSTNNAINKDALPDIVFKAVYDNGDTHKNSSLSLDRTSRLIECIEESIRRKIHYINEAINDEEEEGTAETGIDDDRCVQESQVVPVIKDNYILYSDTAKSVLHRYIKLVDKRFEQCRVTGKKIITKDDLNYFSLCIFVAIEICYLNRSRYQFKKIDTQSKSYYQKKLYESLDFCMNVDGTNALKKFLDFCKSANMRGPYDEDFEIKAKRTMKYVILFGTLFRTTNTDVGARQFIWPKMLNYIKQLAHLLKLPSIDYLTNELMPISERYGFVFSASNIERFVNALQIKPILH